MSKRPAAQDIATQLLGTGYDALDARAQKVALHVAARTHIARNVAGAVAAPDPRPGKASAGTSI